ncbi:MAG TPA: Holliday junction resolvase RuvX [Deltaproteobacteria bacterium]|nr:Holliday junction resolvase RuvX [Deltaproteobacteria bacterium]
MRILGIDYGTKRIGIAVSDPAGIMAHPLKVLEVRPDDSHLLEIQAIARSYGVEKIVVGLPYNMDGTEGPKAREACLWGERVAELTGLPVVFWDERLSSFEAEELLAGHEVSPKRMRKLVDKIAAGIILQGYLDSQKT